jgi:hypothetical protein
MCANCETRNAASWVAPEPISVEDRQNPHYLREDHIECRGTIEAQLRLEFFGLTGNGIQIRIQRRDGEQNVSNSLGEQAFMNYQIVPAAGRYVTALQHKWQQR